MTTTGYIKIHKLQVFSFLKYIMKMACC
jgi:hypothetical protein